MEHFSQTPLDWLALYLVKGLGNVGALNLLEKFDGPEKIFSADYDELIKVEGVNKKGAWGIVNRQFAIDPEYELERVEKCNARVITYSDPEYPDSLRQIHDPPIILYAKGRRIPKDLLFVAVVGSRNPTHYGLETAKRIGAGLAKNGVGVVSGLARGIDGIAQWACIKSGGFSIGVIGTGIDIAYPSSNRKLFEEIVNKGTIISEFPVGTKPEPRNFPIRNRIISGISAGVVVVEATRKSGSLITAAQALDQGRDIFAVPGSINSLRSTGTHFLIKQGAKLVENVQDILEEIGNLGPIGLKREEEQSPEKGQESLSDNEKVIYSILGDYPMHIDEIVRSAKLEPGLVLSMLLQMELEGLVKQLPGKMFVKK